MSSRWLVVAAGASVLFASSAASADSIDELRVRPERPAGYRADAFAEKSVNRAVPLVVPLREAWESGAFAWPASRRAAFANDPSSRSNVIGLSAVTARQRDDRDPAQWLPATSARCDYVKRWIAVKRTWNLSVDPAEAARLRRLSAACPTATVAPTTIASTAPPPAPTNPPSSTTTVPSVTTVRSSTTIAATVPAGNAALAQLATIRVSPEYTAGYDRELFPHWKDLDGDGCDARENVLIRDSIVKTTLGSGCKVLVGKWVSPYDGATWTDPADIDIDHVVALNEAWQSGAYAWTTQQRTLYANDLTDSRTLMAVTDSVNQQKSDKDPTEWLPPLASYRCTYLANWIAVKARWSLRMDQAEYDTVKAGVSGCAVNSSIAAALPTTVPVVATPQTTTQAATQTTAGQATVYVSPGAFCSPYGATGQSSSGVTYTCKPSDTEARNRWRR